MRSAHFIEIFVQRHHPNFPVDSANKYFIVTLTFKYRIHRSQVIYVSYMRQLIFIYINSIFTLKTQSKRKTNYFVFQDDCHKTIFQMSHNVFSGVYGTLKITDCWAECRSCPKTIYYFFKASRFLWPNNMFFVRSIFSGPVGSKVLLIAFWYVNDLSAKFLKYYFKSLPIPFVNWWLLCLARDPHC